MANEPAIPISDAVAVAAGPAAWIGKVAREWGIFAGMTAFFIWQSSVREGALNKRNDEQNDWIRDTMAQVITSNTRAIEGFRVAMERRQP
jgi:hypothetical protein